ncbi:MAG: hypothetical protein WBW94_12485 [Anaerolineales bacterium]
MALESSLSEYEVPSKEVGNPGSSPGGTICAVGETETDIVGWLASQRERAPAGNATSISLSERTPL